MRQIFIIFIVCLLPKFVISQSNFSAEQISKFKHIYNTTKETTSLSITEKEFIKIREANNLSELQIKNITEKINQRAGLDQKERNFIDELKALQAFKKDERVKHVKSLCKQYGLSEEDYNSMLNLYHSSIRFQNQVCRQV